MAPIPAWTKKEWRPLAMELCARYRLQPCIDQDTEAADPSGTVSGRSKPLLEGEAMLLRADRIVGQLYMHGFLDCTPQQVDQQARGLATKFRVHSLDERAERLEALAKQCDYQVVKLLMELAVRPTAASDEAIAVDYDAVHARRMRVEERAAAEEEMRNRVIEELVEISTNDEWFQEWEQTSDEDDDDEMEESASEHNALPAQIAEVLTPSRRAKRSSDVLDEHDWTTEQGTINSNAVVDESLRALFGGAQPSSDIDSYDSRTTRNSIQWELWQLSDDEMHDKLMERSFPLVDLGSGSTIVDSRVESLFEANSRFALELTDIKSVAFSIDRPWTLCPGGATEFNHKPDRSPVTLIHEESCLHMIFRAFEGVETELLELRQSEEPTLVFHLKFVRSEFALTAKGQNVAVSHLSPTSLHHVLDKFAEVASDLQFIRDIRRFIIDSVCRMRTCVTLEGFASALSEVLLLLESSISSVEEECYRLLDSNHDEDASWLERNAARIQFTLLGVYSALKHTFRTISWIKTVLQVCCTLPDDDAMAGAYRSGECANCVLTGLFRLLEAEYIERIEVIPCETRSEWSRYNILVHLLTSSLCPYLDLLEQCLFERGYRDSTPISPELFFVDSTVLPQSPTMATSVEYQTFRSGLMQLAPFDVDATIVPSFLHPVLDLMKDALTSRQLMSQFIKSHRIIGACSNSLQLSQESLKQLFSRDMEEAGCSWSPSNRGFIADPHHMSATVPIKQVLGKCLLSHLTRKCEELKGATATMFRDRLRFLEYVEALRQCVLMQQEDVFSIFSKEILTRITENPQGWVNSEQLNTSYQTAIHQITEDGGMSSSSRNITERIQIRIDSKKLNAQVISRKMDVASIKCLYFTLATPQPLRVLFSSNILLKYSKIAVLLIQVKAVESAILKFKRGIRHRRCYPRIAASIRTMLLRIADMFHYTKCLMNYLINQIGNAEWSKHRDTLASSCDLAEMNSAHERYLDQLLNRFFLLDKHATVIQYILTTFNQVLRYVQLAEELVDAVERRAAVQTPSTTACKQPDSDIWSIPATRTYRGEMTKCAGEFKRQSHFLVVMLTAMQKHSASTHVGEILTQLNFNYYYHQQQDSTQERVRLHHRP